MILTSIRIVLLTLQWLLYFFTGYSACRTFKPNLWLGTSFQAWNCRQCSLVSQVRLKLGVGWCQNTPMFSCAFFLCDIDVFQSIFAEIKNSGVCSDVCIQAVNGLSVRIGGIFCQWHSFFQANDSLFLFLPLMRSICSCILFGHGCQRTLVQRVIISYIIQPKPYTTTNRD